MNDLIHPIADLFPLIEGDEFESLKDDIKANGLLEPIWLYDGKIIDGRNRYNACEVLGISPAFRHYTGSNPLDFALSLNLHRRHLSESQRAMVAVKMANYRHGGDRISESANLHLAPNSISANLHLGVSRKEAAEKLNVSLRSVATAAKVMQAGAAELTKAVERGQISVNAAAAIAPLPQEQQRDLVAAGPAQVKKAAAAIRKNAKPASDIEQSANLHLAPSVNEAEQNANLRLAPEPSELEAMRHALEEANDAIQALTERNGELEQEVTMLRLAADPDVPARIAELRAQIKVVESQRNDFQNKCNELTKEVKRLQRQLGKKHA